MAKSPESVATKYPNVSGIFAAREELRRRRAEASPTEKLRILGELQEFDKILKSAKVIKKGRVKRD